MKSFEFDVGGKTAVGVEIPLPKAPLILAKGESGFVMCGYLNVEAADKLGVAAAVVKGVSSVVDLLKGSVVAVSRAAQKKGIKVGMSGMEALIVLV